MTKEHISVLDLSYLTDPEVFAINLLPSHSTLKQKNLLLKKGDPISLDGEWEYARFEKMTQDLEGFISGDDPTKLGVIKVPLTAEVQEKNSLQYVNVPYPWDGKNKVESGEMDLERDPVNVYRKKFVLKKEEIGDKVVLSFKGFESAAYFFLNGHFIGYSERIYVPTEINVVDYVIEGENVLVVYNFAYSTSSWLLDQDFWKTSGLFRGVTLQSFSSLHLNDVKVVASLDDSYIKGTLSIDAEVEGEGSLSFSLTKEGKTVLEGEIADNHFEAKDLDIIPWSAESPILYDLTLYLKNSSGVIEETSSLRVGFKRSEIKNGILLFNGKRLLIRGVNRHEWSMHYGRAVTKEETLFDLKLLKEHNFNAIRTCHYPDSEYFYELADELGFYILDEACVESHGTWSDPQKKKILPHNEENWFPICVDRADSMVRRDRNHASVFMWSMGNESYGGIAFVKMRERIKELDERPIHYESVFHEEEFNYVTDVRSEMYTPASEVRAYLKKHHDKPFILCEYAHAMGNSLGDMKAYMDLFDEFEQFQGGFIWDYIDQGFLDVTEDGIKGITYGGDHDDRPDSYNFNCNGILWADRDDTARNPKLNAVKSVYSPIQVSFEKTGLKVTNRHLFTGADIYHLLLEYLDDGNVIDSKEIPLSLGPSSSISLPLPKSEIEAKGEKALRVRVLESEKEIAVFGDDVPFAYEAKKDDHPGEIIIGKQDVGYRHEDLFALFSFEQNQGLASLVLDNKELLKFTPRLTFWRPSTDNDRGNRFALFASRCFGWSRFSSFVNYKGLKIKPSTDGELIITTSYDLEESGKPSAEIEYRFGKGGYLDIALRYYGAKLPFTLPCFGWALTLPKEFDHYEYYGRGPFETYPDREGGTALGIYKGNSKDDFLPHSIPQECGNKADARWVKVTDGKTTLKIEALSGPFSFKLLPYDEFMIEEAQHDYELPKSRFSYLTILAKMRGVGGDDSWGQPVHPQFEIPADKDIELVIRVSKDK